MYCGAQVGAQGRVPPVSGRQNPPNAAAGAGPSSIKLVVFDLLDLRFLGTESLINTYLLDLEAGLTLVDCGPSSTLETLEAQLDDIGLGVHDLRHILLTHIHFDHAGAAGGLVAKNPRIRVHVSELGAPHLVEPERLERSARRLYGETFDALWGEIVAVPAENIHIADRSVLGLECFPTPGHASHHISFMSEDGILFAGDATGIRLSSTGTILPVTPPPDIDLEIWHRSLDEIERRVPDALALPHFGLVAEPEQHLTAFRQRLMLWAERVRSGIDEGEFVARVRLEIDARDDDVILERTFLLEHSYLGLKRYWSKLVENGSALK